MGDDNRWYLVDLARIFPAEPPLAELKPNIENNKLVHLIRPEMIKRQDSTISSEAFSIHSTEKDKDAGLAIFNRCIERILQISDELNKGTIKFTNDHELMRYLHAHGICVRQLSIKGDM